MSDRFVGGLRSSLRTVRGESATERTYTTKHGTKATMEFGFFQQHFAARGITTRVLEAAQRQELDRIIWEELTHGRIEPASRAAARTMLADMARQGMEAIILGCTELSLLIEPADTPLPLYDTTRLHAEAILAFAQGQKLDDPP